MVAEKKSVAPFEPTEIQIDEEIPLDPASLFTSDNDIDDEYEKSLAEMFPGKLNEKMY